MITVGADIKARQVSLSAPSLGLVGTITVPERTKHSREEQLNVMRSHVVRFASELGGPAALWIEKPFLSTGPAGNPTSTIRLAEVSTVVRTAVTWHQVEQVVPSTWKAQVIGHGHADKDDIQAWLDLCFPDLAEMCEREDEYDATCIALYGELRLDFGIQPPEKKVKTRGRRPASGRAAPEPRG